jgi:hypothetical protein
MGLLREIGRGDRRLNELSKVGRFGFDLHGRVGNLWVGFIDKWGCDLWWADWMGVLVGLLREDGMLGGVHLIKEVVLILIHLLIFMVVAVVWVAGLCMSTVPNPTGYTSQFRHSNGCIFIAKVPTKR